MPHSAKRKALVTGGAGFIGSHLVERLVADGWRVLVIDDLSRGSAENVDPNAELCRCGLTDSRLAEVVGSFAPDVVFHLAAQIDVRRSVADPVADAETNILGSLNLLQACVIANVRQCVFSSTGGAMYGTPEVLPANEAQPEQPDSPYGIAKLAVEHYLRFHRQAHGLSSVSLRYGNVYGPRQDPHGEAGVIAIFIEQMLRGKRPTIFGDGEQLRDYVYVSDVVEANVAALDHDIPRPINIGTGVGTSVNTLFTMLAQKLPFRGGPAYAPARPGEVMRCYLDGRAAGEHLGWRPRMDLDEGIDRTVAYFRARARQHEGSRSEADATALRGRPVREGRGTG